MKQLHDNQRHELISNAKQVIADELSAIESLLLAWENPGILDIK